MNCAEARQLLTDLAGGDLDSERGVAVRAHAAACSRCAAELGALEQSIGLCRRAGGEPLPEGFTLRLRQRLNAAGAPERSWLDGLRALLTARPLLSAGAVAALAALIATASTAAFLRAPRGEGATVAFRVPENKVALVKIDFFAERAVEDVAFEITLPDGLRFVSGGVELAERSFRFEGKLNAGSNPIPIAVKGPRAGRYKVIAHAVGMGGDHLEVTHEVVLEVRT